MYLRLACVGSWPLAEIAPVCSRRRLAIQVLAAEVNSRVRSRKRTSANEPPLDPQAWFDADDLGELDRAAPATVARPLRTLPISTPPDR